MMRSAVPVMIANPNSASIRHEIQRFESVHPSIYALYDLIDILRDNVIQQQMKEHVVCIEDSFVNSQEWTLSRTVPEIRLGVLGTYSSGKSALVHRYLTGAYLQEESPEGGRFKKEVVIDNKSHLLLIRDEGGPPDMQFSQWVDGVILAFSLEDEVSFNTVYTYHSQMMQYRSGLRDIPVLLVGTQDAISEANPRLIDDGRSRLLANELKCSAYYETCATYGLNVERVFHDACLRIVRASQFSLMLPGGGGTASPNHHQTLMSSQQRAPSRGSISSISSKMSSSGTSQQLLSRDFDMSPTVGLGLGGNGMGNGLNRGSVNRSSVGANGLLSNKMHSPPFREVTPTSGCEAMMSDLPQKATTQRYPMNVQTENIPPSSTTNRQLVPRSLSSHSSIREMSSPSSMLQVGGEFNRGSCSPASTPVPARQLGSFKNTSNSSGFTVSGSQDLSLLRYSSQSNLRSNCNDLPGLAVVVPTVNSRGKVEKTFAERVDAFLKELSREHPSAAQPRTDGGLTHRARSYSVQVLEQSGDSSRDFSSPCTTPTPARKNRRRSNIFSRKENDDKKLKNADSKVGVGRVIPLKQGYLCKWSNKALSKDWQKKYVTLLDDGRLVYHSSLHDYMEDIHAKEIQLVRTTVKIPGGRPRGSESVSSVGGQLSAGSRLTNGQSKALDSSFEGTNGSSQTSSEAMVISGSSSTPGVSLDGELNGLSCSVPNGLSSKADVANGKKKHRRIKSSSKSSDLGLDADDGAFEFMIVSLDNKQWMFSAATAEERDEWVTAIEQQIHTSLQSLESDKSKSRLTPVSNVQVSQIVRSIPGNANCADCDAPDPVWASLNLGALICIDCCGIHRNLGTHLSRVRSLDLDDWPPEMVTVVSSIGNRVVNRVWEANTNGRHKPTSSSPRDEKDQWIRAKYEQKEFLAALPYSDVAINRQLFDAVARKDVYSTLLVLAHSSPSIVNAPYSDTDTRTPVHIAAAVGNLVLLQLLVWNGANVLMVDHEGFNAAYYAQIARSTECVQLLQSLGCPVHPVLRM